MSEKFKTNTEILSQIDNLKYVSNKIIPIIRFIKVFIIYRKMINIFCPEDLYILNKEIRKVGFINGVHQILREAQNCLSSRKLEKQHQINKEENSRSIREMYEKFKEKNNISKINEDDLLQGLTTEELEKRNQSYSGGVYHIPDNIIYNQRVIDNGIEGEIEWIIFDKIYGCWFAVVTSPHRVKMDGKKGCVLFRDINFDNLQQQLRIEIIMERNRQTEYMAARSKKPNINRVRKIMGVDNDSILNGDDIF